MEGEQSDETLSLVLWQTGHRVLRQGSNEKEEKQGLDTSQVGFL